MLGAQPWAQRSKTSLCMGLRLCKVDLPGVQSGRYGLLCDLGQVT